MLRGTKQLASRQSSPASFAGNALEEGWGMLGREVIGGGGWFGLTQSLEAVLPRKYAVTGKGSGWRERWSKVEVVWIGSNPEKPQLGKGSGRGVRREVVRDGRV